MQPQVVADRRAADAAAKKERRRLERAARHDDRAGSHRDRARVLAGRRVYRLDARGAPVLGEHAGGAAADHDLGVVLGGGGEPGLFGGVLSAPLGAEAEVAGRLERVLRRVRVAHYLAEVPAELLA